MKIFPPNITKDGTSHVVTLLRFCLFALISLCLSCGGCNSCQQSSTPKEWTYQSTHAPYSLYLSSQWKQTDPAKFNAYADLALERGPLRSIIIAQPLAVSAGYRI